MTTTYDFDDREYLEDTDMRGELDRVFDHCHGCRLCWNLCPSFGSLFEMIDAKTDGIHVELPREDQDRVVDECYQCKLCYIKCPYVPPHEWQLDFPGLMLRAFLTSTRGKARSLGDKLLAETDLAGAAAVMSGRLANMTLKPNSIPRKAMEWGLGISAQRVLHPYAKERFTTWWRRAGFDEAVRPFSSKPKAGSEPGAAGPPSFLEPGEAEIEAQAARPVDAGPPATERPAFLEPGEAELAAQSARPGESTQLESTQPGEGEAVAPPTPAAQESPPRKVTLFPTCLVEYQDPSIGRATVRVMRHNGCDVACADGVRCCGMPQLDAGDMGAFLKQARQNVRALAPEVRVGRAIVVPQPTCNYVLRKEYPRHLDADPDAAAVAAAVVDPAEYLVRLRQTTGIADDFTTSLGKVAYHAACHLRAQQQGYKARDLLRLAPDTTVTMVESCAGIDGTWGYRVRNYAMAKDVIAPTAEALRRAEADVVVGDCLLADQAISEEGLPMPLHPMQALARAYGLEDT